MKDGRCYSLFLRGWVFLFVVNCFFLFAKNKDEVSPPKVFEEDCGEQLQEVASILLKWQHQDKKNLGQWWWVDDPEKGMPYRPPMNRRLGATAICLKAMGAIQPYLPEKMKNMTQKAREKAIQPLLRVSQNMTAKKIKKNGNNNWMALYSLDCLLEMRRKKNIPEDLSDKVDAAIRKLIEALQEGTCPDGSWTYARRRGFTFMTAPTLLAFFEARRQGEDVDDTVIEKALTLLENDRLANGAFQYQFRRNINIDPTSTEAGAAARSPLCELVLFLAKRNDIKNVENSLDRFFNNWKYLEDRREANRDAKKSFHGGPYRIAPYYYMFSHYYVALAIELLPDDEKISYRQKLLKRLESVHRPKRGWNDMPNNRSNGYSSAMAALCFLAPTVDLPRYISSEEASAPLRKKMEE
jgi:hypothetical protein